MMGEAIKILEEKARFHDGCADQSMASAQAHAASMQAQITQAVAQRAKADMFRAAVEKLKA
jgi:hypothetical protein